ncbi:aminotransferase class I/II-fold pyridoxal phosphate-dependent enzyme [Deltaproteobacteria bacterium OttesenSCG-928-M10]|nr:aminotransferase class I/II-fold pyridoxal phosphate-dependent enzyme [Deltaproteobacteria bacterium OttesenSCG-928-M10]
MAQPSDSSPRVNRPASGDMFEFHPESPSIHLSTAYVIADLDAYDQASGGGGYVYSRLKNPTRAALAGLITELEHGDDSVVLCSGMAAISTAVMALADGGAHVVTGDSIYAEAVELFDQVLSRFGLSFSYVDLTDIEAVAAALTPATKIIYLEPVTNPLIKVVDLEKIAELAHRHGAMVVVDSTFTTPLMINPLDHGADLVVHSLTKFIGGHGDVTAGSITGRGEAIKKTAATARLLGPLCDPQSAWLLMRSLRTFDLRVTRQMDNAARLAESLSQNPRVRQVNYPGLPGHPQHDLAARMFGGRFGAMLSFRVEDDREKVNEFLHRLKTVRYLATLGGDRTSVAHPATAFRLDFSPEELLKFGMHEGLIRISAGLEPAEEIIGDLNQALAVFAADG